ncbi:MAG: hypothetical protein ACK5IN_09935 [Microbacterium sp.]|uniref:hypothetical protein n=1 Tax=Microbacterium sp. TaxID=51671 RepID=UPI003A89EEEB
MRILLKLEIGCDVDAAWRALHSPRAVAELYGPIVDLDPLDPAGLATSWASPSVGVDGAVGVQLRLASILPLGRQLIHPGDLTLTDPRDGEPVRVLRDAGIPISGPLAALDVWDHQIAVSPSPHHPERTLWRDRLVIGGAAAPLLWPLLWGVWQWRAARLRVLAPTWAHDLPERNAAEAP